MTRNHLLAASLLLASGIALAQAPAAPAAKPAAAPAAATLNLVPAFIGACINPGPDVGRIRDALVKAGGTPAPEIPGVKSDDPKRPVGYMFKEQGQFYSVIFNRGGTCTVVSRQADIEKSKLALTQFVAGSTGVFDIVVPKDPKSVQGESVISAFMLSSRSGHSGMAITLSTVTRGGERAVFLTRRLVATK